jgi:hypothetical protein
VLVIVTAVPRNSFKHILRTLAHHSSVDAAHIKVLVAGRELSARWALAIGQQGSLRYERGTDGMAFQPAEALLAGKAKLNRAPPRADLLSA